MSLDAIICVIHVFSSKGHFFYHLSKLEKKIFKKKKLDFLLKVQMLGKYDVRQANVTGRVWGRKQIFRYYAEKN